MDIDYEKLKKNIDEATNDKELDKLLKKYQDNLGLSAGDPEIDFLFEARRKFIYRTTPETPSPSPSPSPPQTEFSQDSANASNDKFIYNFPGIPLKETEDNRVGCEKATDCAIRSAHGMKMLSQNDRDALVKMIGAEGIRIEQINTFLKSKQRNMRLIEVPISGIDIHSWAMKKMRDDTCSMVVLRLKPNDDPNIKYGAHAVIICKAKNVITLWDTQRYQDYPKLVRNESKDAIKKYLKTGKYEGTNFSLIKGEKEIELDKLFAAIKIKSRRNKKTPVKNKSRRKKKTPVKSRSRRKNTKERQKTKRATLIASKRKSS